MNPKYFEDIKFKCQMLSQGRFYLFLFILQEYIWEKQNNVYFMIPFICKQN